MNKTTSLLITTLTSVIAFTGGACSSGKVSPTGTGGTAGDGGNANFIYLTSSPTGFVNEPISGVIGPWFSYDDASDCVNKGGFAAADCSQITTPTPGQPFMPTDTATSQMCTSGVAALVMNKGGSPDYTDIWGAGIELQFNNPGGDAGVVGYFDMTPYKGMSFDFSADLLPAGALRVNFPFNGEYMGDNSPYWMGATMKNSPLTGTTASPQHVELNWTDVGGPLYLTQRTPAVTPPPFDATAQSAVQAIQFAVVTNAQTTTPYSFCVANLALVKK